MTGFPGETDEFFEETRRFLHDLPVSYLHVFTYSKRPGTEAYSMHGHVDEKVKKERNKILRNLSDKKSFEFYSENLLSEKKVLIEKVDSEGNAFGHTENYIYAKFRFNVNTGVNQLQMVRLLEVVSDNNGQLLATAEALN
jgi:threonylcarbamoyladenosine tRNA methylthiotransferase MtaB